MMQKTMTKRTRKILITLVVVDISIALISIIFFDIKILWNTQFGFISAALIMLASMKSYARMVDARVELGIVTVDDSQDVIDKLEDPYDLYGEDAIAEEKDLIEVVKEERKKLKSSRSTAAQTLKDAKAALSLYRIGAYVLLILGFMYLNRQDLLHIPSYILALSVPMFVVVYVLISTKEDA